MKVQRAYKAFLVKVVTIQRFARKQLYSRNVFSLIERNRQAPIIQKHLRGYLAREKVAVELHRKRM